MKVFMATPSYKGVTCIGFLDSLQETVTLFKERGHESHWQTVEGCCYVQTARNDLVFEFLKSDADVLLFLDDDVSWNAADALKLVESNDDVIAGIYRLKTEQEGYPVVIRTNGQHRPLVRADGCISAACVATGFLKISRKCIEKMVANYPQYKYAEYVDREFIENKYDLFPQGVHGGRWVGEDFAFCRLWTQLLGEIWVMPDMDLTHHGATEYKGNYHQFLLKQKGGSDDV